MREHLESTRDWAREQWQIDPSAPAAHSWYLIAEHCQAVLNALDKQDTSDRDLAQSKERVKASIVAEIEAASTPAEVEAVKKKWYNPLTWAK